MGCLEFGSLLSSSSVKTNSGRDTNQPSVRRKLAAASLELKRPQTRTQLFACKQFLRLNGNKWNDDDDDDENDELERMWKEVVVT